MIYYVSIVLYSLTLSLALSAHCETSGQRTARELPWNHPTFIHCTG